MCCFLRSNIGYCSVKKQPYLECKSNDECSSNKCVDLKHGHECLGTLFEYDAKCICTGTGAMTEHDIADNNGKNGLDVGAECLDFDFDPNDTFDHPEGVIFPNNCKESLCQPQFPLNTIDNKPDTTKQPEKFVCVDGKPEGSQCQVDEQCSSTSRCYDGTCRTPIHPGEYCADESEDLLCIGGHSWCDIVNNFCQDSHKDYTRGNWKHHCGDGEFVKNFGTVKEVCKLCSKGKYSDVPLRMVIWRCYSGFVHKSHHVLGMRMYAVKPL